MVKEELGEDTEIKYSSTAPSLQSLPLMYQNHHPFITWNNSCVFLESVDWMNSSGIIPPAWRFFSEDKLIASPKAFLEPSITSVIIMRWTVKQREQSCIESWTQSKNICVCQRSMPGLPLLGNVLHTEMSYCFHVAITQAKLVKLGFTAGATTGQTCHMIGFRIL